MNFSVTKKKLEKEELYPGVPVLIQNGTSFQFNEEAMRRFGFPLNTANVSKITNGFDDENKLALAVLAEDTAYTNNVTAKNTFSSAKFTERLISQFGGGLLDKNVFKLDFIEGDMKAAYVKEFEVVNTIASQAEAMECVLDFSGYATVVDDMTENVYLPEPPAELFIEEVQEEATSEVSTELQPQVTSESAISNVAKSLQGW